MYLKQATGMINLDHELFFFEKIAKIVYIITDKDKMEIVRCANMKLKNFHHLILSSTLEFDTFADNKTRTMFLKKSFMLGVNNYEKIFKMHKRSVETLPMFCHGMRFNNEEIK